MKFCIYNQSIHYPERTAAPISNFHFDNFYLNILETSVTNILFKEAAVEEYAHLSTAISVVFPKLALIVDAIKIRTLKIGASLGALPSSQRTYGTPGSAL